MSRGPKPAPRPRGRAKAVPAGAGRGALRVVAGTLGGRRFDAPPGEATRPTADRVRQATFNALDSLGAIDGARVLDAFAGSGALAIEALSRGASSAVLAETGPSARRCAEGNVASLGLADRAVVVGMPAVRALVHGPFDLVLLDPPYAFDGWAELLDAVAVHLSVDAVVVLESDREVPLPPSLRGLRVRTYGGTVVGFATPAGAPS